MVAREKPHRPISQTTNMQFIYRVAVDKAIAERAAHDETEHIGQTGMEKHRSGHE
jgi:hypothetical protein